MSEPTDELFPALRQLRDWLDNDISQLRRPSRTPAPYGAALCIVVGCEALSRLLKVDPPHGIFARELIEHHNKGFTRTTGKDIFQALRNGLAHIYDTEFIRIGRDGPEVELIVSWEPYTHLQIIKNDRGIGLVLHVPTMWDDLQRVLRKALSNVQEGDRQTVSLEWKNSRVWDGSDEALREWEGALSVGSGQPFGRRSRCRHHP